MKNILIGLIYAVGIILAETAVVAAWYCSPLVVNFDGSWIALLTVIALPVITAVVATKDSRDKLIEKGAIIGLALWCIMLVPICWTLPMLISKKLLITSLLIYIGLSIGGSLCSGNIRFIRSLRKKPQEEPNNA